LPILAVAGSDRSWLVLCGPNAAWVISRAGIDLTPQTLSISGTAAASDGTNFLVAGSGLNGVIATVVTSDGSVVVKDRPVLAGGLPVGVRSNGREYLIAARDTTRVMLQRVDAEGSPLGQPIEVPATGNSLINIAPFGRGWIAMYDSDAGAYAFRIAADGTMLDSPAPVEMPQRIAANGDGSITAAYLRSVSTPPYGSADAIVLRDWTIVAPRRRAAH